MNQEITAWEISLNLKELADCNFDFHILNTWKGFLPIVDRLSIDDATFSVSSMLLNLSFIKSKFLQHKVSVPCWPVAFFSICSTAECRS